MEKLFNNRFVEIFIDHKQQLLFNVWTEESNFKDLTFEKFKKILLEWQRLALEYKVKYTLTDARNLDVPFVPEWQDWIVVEVHTPLKQAGFLEKQAYILPKDFIANVSVNMTLEDSEESNPEIEVRRYIDIDEAKRWLLS